MKLDEATALAVLYTNLKKRKRVSDPILIAESAKFLVELYDGSYEKVADVVGTHPSVIRKWARLANAPDEFKQYVKDNKIYPVAAFAIMSAFPDPELQSEIAKAIAGCGEAQITRLVKLKKRNPDFSIDECKKKVMSWGSGRNVDKESKCVMK